MQRDNKQQPKSADAANAELTHEWTNRDIPAGSARYYSILHAEPDTRDHLRAITALIGVWSRLAFSSSETEIALRKVVWWREELSGEHRVHPITRALEQSLSEDPRLVERLTEILGGYSDLLQFGSPSTDEANKLFHWSTGAVACQALLGAENSANNPVARAGVALSRFRCLRYLAPHVKSKLLCLPLSVLEANQLSPGHLQPGSENPELTVFFKHQLQTLDAEMEETASQLLHAGPETRPLYIYLRAQLQLLRKLTRKGSNLLVPQPPLSPLKNYFIAFRAAKQHYQHN